MEFYMSKIPSNTRSFLGGGGGGGAGGGGAATTNGARGE
jgi:hypothetical protein